ncbi:MAG: HEAT repeat domain-containing protein [Deltaproteobacteria bacterium]|nr:HEAT repeat domain-containing protein [Deltaproteobacteria bacterium]
MAVAEEDGGGEAGSGEAGGAAAVAGGVGEAGGAAEVPPLRVRLALRPRAAAEDADPVTREDVFFSELAAALSSRPLFEADPEVARLSEGVARAAARRQEDGLLSSTRSSGLEPFLVVDVGLQRPAAGAAVTEPTYVVGLTLVIRRAAEREALDVPPGVRWELDLPARSVRSERLVGTVAQAIEARAQVELDREAAAGREVLADPLLGERPEEAEAALYALGRVSYGDLAQALEGSRPEARVVAAGALGRAGDPDLLSMYAALLRDGEPAIRLAGVEGFWRAARGAPPAVVETTDAVPAPGEAWLVPAGETACRFGADIDFGGGAVPGRAAVLAEHLEELRGALGDPDPRVAHAVLVLLTESGDAEVRTAIREALRGVEGAAAQDLLAVALGRLGDRSAAPRLRQIVREGRELGPAAAVPLGRLGDRGADEALRGMLAATDERVRCAAAEALAGARDAASVEALMPLLSGEQPSQVVRAAEAALVAAGEPAIGPLGAALDAADPSIAWGAAEVLGAIGSEKAVPPLVAKLAGLDAVLRDYIVGALGAIGDVRALPELIAAFGGNPAYRNEQPILRAILLFGRRAIGALVEGLDSPDAAVRAGALEALVRLEDTEHVAAVLPLLEDADGLVRARAAAYFTAARDERAVEALSALLEGTDAEAAGEAAGALGAIGGSEARATLERALGAADGSIAAAAAQALARIGEAESVRAILDAASRMSAYDRGRLVEAIVSFGPAAREPLVEGLGGDRLRPAALQALDGLGIAVGVPLLAPYRADERASVRELVARLLGRTEDAAALEPLEVLLADSSPAVREAAVGAVTEVGGVDAAELLRSVLAGEKDDWVKRAIRRALLQLDSVP